LGDAPAAPETIGDLPSATVDAKPDDQLNSASAARAGDPSLLPGQEYFAGQTVAPAKTSASGPTGAASDLQSEIALHGKAIDPAYARSYAEAQAIIASDSELRTAVLMAENAGDKTFKDRLATIIADLKRTPETALEAIREETFANQTRAGSRGTGVDIVANHATQKAFNRLESLSPGQGVWQARDAGFRAAVDLSQEQQRLLYMIAQQPGSVWERLDRMAQAGLFDPSLASSLFGLAGSAYRGPLLGPADRPDPIPSGSLRPQKATVPNAGELSIVRRQPLGAEGLEALGVGRPEIEEFRARIGVPTRHTMAVARTTAPGLDGFTFYEASPRVRDEGGLPRATPGPIASPSRRPFDWAHAEEDIANQFVRAVEERGLKPSDLDGHKLVIHVSNPRGVCPTCRQGLDSSEAPGVLKQLSERYPGLTIHVTVPSRQGIRAKGPTNFAIRNGQYVNWREQ
jgi:hypothetical protein